MKAGQRAELTSLEMDEELLLGSARSSPRSPFPRRCIVTPCMLVVCGSIGVVGGFIASLVYGAKPVSSTDGLRALAFLENSSATAMHSLRHKRFRLERYMWGFANDTAASDPNCCNVNSSWSDGNSFGADDVQSSGQRKQVSTNVNSHWAPSRDDRRDDSQAVATEVNTSTVTSTVTETST